MIVGTVREVKDHETRVGLTPTGVGQLVQSGHTVLVESSAGLASGFDDAAYVATGAQIAPAAASVWSNAELIVKVKEPQESELGYLRDGLGLFTFLHLAGASEQLTQQLLQRGVTSIAYETVQLPNGNLPLLTPMSEVAGCVAVQKGAQYLEFGHGGQGKLLASLPGVLGSEVVILGGGVVGSSAARIALGMGARVTIFDVNGERLRELAARFGERLETRFSQPAEIFDALRTADLLIGAVLVPGARAPKIVSSEMVRSMRKGSVIVDVAIDQGGCVETSTVTSHSAPVFDRHGVIHYGVPNMPALVPNSSTRALCNVTIGYIRQLADMGLEEALTSVPELARAVNTHRGAITHPAVAEALELPFVSFPKLNGLAVATKTREPDGLAPAAALRS